MSIKSPNYTQIPNEFFDKMMADMGEAEIKVLMAIMRKTFGWHKIRDQISLSQLEEITGLHKQAIIGAIKILESKGLVLKTVTGSNGTQKAFYELIISEDSNNSYPCENHTPPSVKFTPTKETLTKERRKESSLKGAKEKSPLAPPPPSGVFKNEFEGRVVVTEENYQRLKAKFEDAELIKAYAEKLYRWSYNNEKEFRKKKRHDMVIEDWIEKDKEKKKTLTKDSTSLNKAQQENWKKNEELVNELKIENPREAGGLNIYYKHYVLKDRNNSSFDVSCLIDHKDFCRVLGKHLKLNIYQVRFPNG